MPITAKLSKSFYDKLGDDVANELVEWLNSVDTSYRQEFRELFEAHFGRLEARLALIGAEFRADTAREIADLKGRAEGFEARTDARFVAFEARSDARFAKLEKTLIRWMFGFWIGSWAALAGTIIALRQLGAPQP